MRKYKTAPDRQPLRLLACITDLTRHRFHSGLRWSCGNLNARLKGPAGYEEAKSNATKRGLKEPSKAVAAKLSHAMFQVILREKTEERLHLSPSAAHDDDGEEVINGQVGQLMSDMSRLLTEGENIVYE